VGERERERERGGGEILRLAGRLVSCCHYTPALDGFSTRCMLWAEENEVSDFVLGKVSIATLFLVIPDSVVAMMPTHL
jgi:hypothetical protein